MIIQNRTISVALTCTQGQQNLNITSTIVLKLQKILLKNIS